MPDVSAITALLGPTNTGKTHRALERMLEHESGMIGLPLRLLAREVYDKLTAKVGEAEVALITGEEKRVPAGPRPPRYWVSTVEAMPLDREVDFLAVDEVQLAAHDQRGHVFTSRILSARGRKETWFLGSGAMGGVLRELAPTARHEAHPRLSRLSYAGATPLSRLPPRSAVVAFSMPHVYELADRLRAKKGGAAVVLGALSPRTRNAQVAMFQAGEVDWLVATDAIGMGLNLDVGHVAFAALRKFDGREVREVDDAELGQIAGRAGRWIQDGSFGTLTPLELPRGVAHAIEAHAVPRITRVRWRSEALDFSSVRALMASLNQGSRRGVFRQVRDADDHQALVRLSDRERVVALATNEARVRLLWDVCTVPDFRKLLFEAHVDFLEELFVELAHHGRARLAWIEPRLHELRDATGDVETLIARIAATRVWAYVTNQSAWVEAGSGLRERTRALEDDLSDALHARLVLRFVDAKKKHPRGLHPSPPPGAGREKADASERVGGDFDGFAPGHPFAKLAAFRALVPGAEARAAQAPRSAEWDWVEEIVLAPHDALRLEPNGCIVHIPSGRRLGVLVRGTSIGRPDVKLEDGGALGAGARSRLQRRLFAFVRDVVSHLLGDAHAIARLEGTSAHVRGLIHRLEEGLGTALEADVSDVLALLRDDERAGLERAGLRFGAGVVYVPHGLRREALAARAALVGVAHGGVRLPSGGAVSFVPSRATARRALVAVGFPKVGPRAVRADVLDRALAVSRARDASDAPASYDLCEVATWLGVSPREARAILANR